MGGKWAHFKCAHTNKGLVRLQHEGRNVHPFIGKPAQAGTSLKCLYTKAWCWGNSVLLYAYNLRHVRDVVG